MKKLYISALSIQQRSPKNPAVHELKVFTSKYFHFDFEQFLNILFYFSKLSKVVLFTFLCEIIVTVIKWTINYLYIPISN